MASTFNPEISNQIKEDGGTIIYSSGNIIIASEISVELYRELIKSPYIESMESLPLKRYNITQKTDVATIAVDDTIKAFDDLDDGSETDTENQSGASENQSGSA